MQHTIISTRAVLALVSAGLALTVPTQAAVLTQYYNNGAPASNNVAFTMGTDWTLSLSSDSLYAQNTGFNAGTSYRTLYGDGNNLLFKFNRASGDNNAYDVTVNLSGYNQWSGNEGTSPTITLHWGDDNFGSYSGSGLNDQNILAQSIDDISYFLASTTDLTQVASSTAHGDFTWNSGNVTTFRIAANQQSAYMVVLGSANSSSYVYSASADFTAVPEPSGVAMTMGAAGLFLIRRRRIS
jgi:hypothetical protein